MQATCHECGMQLPGHKIGCSSNSIVQRAMQKRPWGY